MATKNIQKKRHGKMAEGFLGEVEDKAPGRSAFFTLQKLILG